jgi:hypothetical protein
MNFETVELHENLPKAKIVEKIKQWQAKAKKFSEDNTKTGKQGQFLFYICFVGDGFHSKTGKIKDQEFIKFQNEFEQIDLTNEYQLTAHNELFRPMVYCQALAGYDHVKSIV